MIFIRRELGNTYADLFLSFVAVLRKFRQKHPRPADFVFHAFFYGETVRLPAFLDKTVVGGKDIGTVGGYDTVDLHRNVIPQHTAFQTLVPMLGFYLASGVDFGRLS